MARSAALLLLVGLLWAPARAADVHLKSGSVIAGRIVADKTDAYDVANLTYQRGDGSVIQTTDGIMAIYKSDIDFLVIDEDDVIDPDKKVGYKIMKRGEEELVEATPKEVEPEGRKIVLMEIEPKEFDTTKTSRTLWRPRKLGPPVDVPEMGLTIRLPERFKHEIVEQGGRKILRAVAEPVDGHALGFNVWRVKKHRVAPFHMREEFFEFTQARVLKALEKGADTVGTIYPRRTPKKLPKLTFGDAVGRTYLVEKGDDRRHIEVRILRTLSEYYVFMFSSPRDIDQDVMPVFDDCFASLKIPE